jgi:hypothetical protein
MTFVDFLIITIPPVVSLAFDTPDLLGAGDEATHRSHLHKPGPRAKVSLPGRF